MRDAPLPLLAAAFLMLTPEAARADEPPREAVRLSYDVGPGLKTCPPEQTLHDEVARRMGYDPFTPDALDRIVATLKRSPRGLTATVERFDSKDVPQWQPKTYDMKSDCALLVQQLAIYISFRFLPFAVPPQPAPRASSPSAVSPTAPPPTPPPPPSPPSSPAPPRPPLAPPPSSPSRAFAIELGLGPLAAFGFAPGPTFAGALHVGFRWPSFSIAVEPRADAPAASSVDRLPSVTIGTFMLGGSVVPCWYKPPLAAWPRLFFMICGVLTTTAVLGHSEGIPSARKDVDVYVGAGPRAGLELMLGSRFIGRFYGDALVSIKPAQARLGGMEVWRSAPVTGDVGGAFLALF
jgi:hypothetical protein